MKSISILLLFIMSSCLTPIDFKTEYGFVSSKEFLPGEIYEISSITKDNRETKIRAVVSEPEWQIKVTTPQNIFKINSKFVYYKFEVNDKVRVTYHPDTKEVYTIYWDRK